MATVDAIFQNLKSNASYASLSDDLLYDIASSLYKQSSFKALELYFQGQMDPYAFSVFAGENLIWAQFTFTEIIQMEEAGVLIPEEVLAWAHSMQDADSTNYEAAETFASDDTEQIEQELNNTEESQLVNLRKVAKSLVAECTSNETNINQKLEQLDVVKKLSESTQNTAEEVQKTALKKMQELTDEWNALEGKLKRGETLTEEEQTRFDELAGLLNTENKQYQKDIKDINIDFEEIAASLNEIDMLSKDTAVLSVETEAVGAELADTEKKHKFISTSTNSIGNTNFITNSSIAKNLAHTAIETGRKTFIFAQDVQVTVNEVASIMNLTEEVTGQANNKPQTDVTDNQADNVENTAEQGAENEFKNAQSVAKTETEEASQTPTSSRVATQPEASTATTNSSSIVGTTTVENPQPNNNEVDTNTLATDNSEEAGNSLKNQTQEQIDACNTRSSQITNAVNEIDPLKKAVEDIKKESKFESKIAEAKVAKQLKEYEQLCDKMKNGEPLSREEENKFEKLNTEFDKENGNYIKGLEEKINTLQGFTRSLNYALDIVNQTFDMANATVEMGKQLAIQELGDRSYLMENFYFMLLDDERQKDLLYGKAGESLGRDAIDRGEVLTQEATTANTNLTKQIPLSNYAQEEANKVGEQKNSVVEKISAITKDVPGIDPNAENQNAEGEQNVAGGQDKEEAENQENSEVSDASVKDMTSQAGQRISETNAIGATAEKSSAQAQKDIKYAEATAKKFKELNAKEKAEQEATAAKVEVLNTQIEQENQKIEQAYANAKTTASLDDETQEPQEAVEAKNVIKLYNTEVVMLLGNSEKATQKLRRYRLTEAAKIQQATNSNNQANEDCSKFEEIVSKTDKFMSWVTTSGVALELTGVGLQLLGKAMLSNPFTAAAGTALIVAGTISFDIGAVAEQVGILGGTVCKLVKTGIAIAEGDIWGALKNLAIAGAVVGGAMMGGTVGLAVGLAGEVAGVATGMIDENSRPDGDNNENTENEQNKENKGSIFGKTKVIGNENIVDEDGTTQAERNAALATNAQAAQNTVINENGANTTTDNQSSTDKSAIVAPTTAQAAPEVEGQSSETTKAIENEEKDGEGQEVNAKNGKQAAKDSAKASEETKTGTRNTEEDGKEAEEVDKLAQKTDKTMQKDSKALEKSIQKDEKTLEKNEQKVQETANKIEEEGLAIENAQTEVEGLISLEEQAANQGDAQPTASAQEQPEATSAGLGMISSASTPMATSSAAGVSSGTSDNQVRIGELNTQIMQRSNKMGLYSGQLAKYQATSDKLIRRMQINNKNFDKAVKKEEKQKKEDVSKSEEILKIAEKFETVSQDVATVGMIVGYTGDLLMKVVLPPWIPIVGAVMSPIGHTTEAIGNVGVVAANVTKTAVYAAQGNLTGALMSIGTAAMSLVSANKAAGQAKKGFQQMGKNIAMAQTKAATYKAAQEAAKAAVKGTGEEAMKQVVEKTKNEFTAKMIKHHSKEGVKAVLKQSGKAALMNANNIMGTVQRTFFDKDEAKEEKKEYQLSAKFREIQRKNATRRRKIRAAYGMGNTGSGTQKNK